MSTEVVKEAKLEEEPRQCTKKEKLGHAIGVLGHDSMYTLWSTWTTPFLTDILKNCMFLFAGLMTISSLVLYFAGYHNAIVLFATSSVSTVCVGAVMVCVNAMMMDTIEYGEWKTGQRNEAMITSTRCFVTKCVMAVAGIAVAAVIGLTGYIPQETVQPVNVLNSFHFVYTLVSAGIIILAVVPMLFYKLTEKRHAEIMEELAARKASKTQ